MIEVILNDRLGKKIRVKCNEDDTIGDLKKLVAAQTGTRPEKIRYNNDSFLMWWFDVGRVCPGVAFCELDLEFGCREEEEKELFLSLSLVLSRSLSRSRSLSVSLCVCSHSSKTRV